MEASALCETIFQFMGQGAPVHAPAPELILPSTEHASGGEGSASTTEEQDGQSMPPPIPTDEGKLASATGGAAAGRKEQLEKEGMMLAFVGNKASVL